MGAVPVASGGFPVPPGTGAPAIRMMLTFASSVSSSLRNSTVFSPALTSDTGMLTAIVRQLKVLLPGHEVECHVPPLTRTSGTLGSQGNQLKVTMAPVGIWS